MYSYKIAHSKQDFADIKQLSHRKSLTQHQMYLMFFASKDLVSYAAFSKKNRTATLHMLYTQPCHRHQGYATSLLFCAITQGLKPLDKVLVKSPSTFMKNFLMGSGFKARTSTDLMFTCDDNSITSMMMSALSKSSPSAIHCEITMQWPTHPIQLTPGKIIEKSLMLRSYLQQLPLPFFYGTTFPGAQGQQLTVNEENLLQLPFDQSHLRERRQALQQVFGPISTDEDDLVTKVQQYTSTGQTFIEDTATLFADKRHPTARFSYQFGWFNFWLYVLINYFNFIFVWVCIKSCVHTAYSSTYQQHVHSFAEAASEKLKIDDNVVIKMGLFARARVYQPISFVCYFHLFALILNQLSTVVEVKLNNHLLWPYDKNIKNRAFNALIALARFAGIIELSLAAGNHIVLNYVAQFEQQAEEIMRVYIKVLHLEPNDFTTQLNNSSHIESVNPIELTMPYWAICIILTAVAYIAKHYTYLSDEIRVTPRPPVFDATWERCRQRAKDLLIGDQAHQLEIPPEVDIPEGTLENRRPYTAM